LGQKPFGVGGEVGGRLGTSATDFESGKWVGIPVRRDEQPEKHGKKIKNPLN
jgi:hypothetical protein